MEAGMMVLQRFKEYILDPTIYLILTAGLLLFIYGLVLFIYKMREGSDYKEGLSHMLWGIIGMFIMVSVYGIIALIINTIGADPTQPDLSRIPEANPGFFK
ncbi:MAG: Uncharacterized protein G01um10148_472 [Parcubacteria group bacterium Gr01-1014_8]|nr:MAG: Uncharacterized protein G01um10148_472 [Parcubacteria group bacterium Gr01-1014_8]